MCPSLPTGALKLTSTADLHALIQQWCPRIKPFDTLNTVFTTQGLGYVTQQQFFSHTLPIIAGHAAQLKSEWPSDAVAPEVLLKGTGGSVFLSQVGAVSRLLAEASANRSTSLPQICTRAPRARVCVCVCV